MKVLILQILLIANVQWGLANTIHEDKLKATDETTFPLEIEALLDYNSGLIFYKDHSIPACFVEVFLTLPDELPILKLPVRSNASIQSNPSQFSNNGIQSSTGMQFCRGLPLYPYVELSNAKTRRKRQTNAYYGNNVPMGEARAQSSWNPPGQASQAQVQGQVFGNGIFSGQAQTQNGGMSQSQVQLAGVGIRGQISSSSGNAQAQLAIGNGAGSGQAGGLGLGPSSSQVQVNLGQQGEETMASASATSGGATAGIGGGPGGGGGLTSLGSSGLPTGGIGQQRLPQQVGLGRESLSGYGLRNGFYPGTTSGGGYSPTGVAGTPMNGGGGGGRDYTSYQPSISGLTGGSVSNGHGRVIQGAENLPSQGVRNGVSETRSGYHSGFRNGLLGQTVGLGSPGIGFPSGLSGIDSSRGLPSQITNGFGPSYGQGVKQNGHPGTLTGSIGDGLPPSGFNGGISGSRPGIDGSRLPGAGQQYLPGGASIPGGGPSTGTSQIGSGGGQDQIGADTTRGVRPYGPGQIYGAGAPSNGIGRTLDFSRGGSRPQSETGRPSGIHTDYQNGASRQHLTNGYRTGLGPHVQSRTPGAYASTIGTGQAQAQTVYFGYSGDGQIVPLRYEQSSQPDRDAGSNGIRRYQDQQVGPGTVRQQQQLPQNGFGLGRHDSSSISTQNGYRLGNGHSTQTDDSRGSTVGRLPQQISGLDGMRTSTQQLQPGGHTTFDGSLSHSGNTLPRQSGQLPVGSTLHQLPITDHGAGNTHSNSGPTITQPGTPVTGYTNGLGVGQTPTGYIPSSLIPTQQGPRQPYAGTNGQSGHLASENGYSQQNVQQHYTPGASTSRNGQPYRINGYGQIIPAGQPRQSPYPTTTTITGAEGGVAGQDGFSPSYGISRPSPEDPDGKKCTIITFSCTIVVESNGRAKICRPNAVKMNGNGNGNSQNGSGSKICCC